MTGPVELLAGHRTLVGDTFPMGPTEVSALHCDRFEAAAGYNGLGIVYQHPIANRD